MDSEKLDEFHKKFESECCSFPNHRFLGHLMDVDINGKNAHDEITCQISLVTRNFLKLDLDLLKAYKNHGKHDTISIFHPYFTELVANITVNDYKDIKSKCNESNWIDLDLFKTACLTYQKSSYGYEGCFIFGASPLKRQHVFFVVGEITDKTIKEKLKNKETAYNELKMYKKTARDISILRSFYAAIEDKNKVKGIVHNVGQANCIELNFASSDDSCTVMFDVGMSICEEYGTSQYKKGYFIDENWRAIRKTTPEWILLSHWDIDHILGVCELDNAQYSVYNDAQWIAADLFQLPFSAISLSALRLCVYLLLIGKIALVKADEDINSLVDSNNTPGSVVRLFTGLGHIGKSSKNNNIGLCMELSYGHEERTHRILLPGDCEYRQFAKNVPKGTKYDFLVASHHGSDNSKDCDICAQGTGIAVVCVGNNTYGHPGSGHIRKLHENGFEVHSVYGWYGISFEMADGKENVDVEFITHYS